MIKKTISYTDFNDKDRTEDFYFNLTQAELAELQLTAPGGDLSAHLQALIDATERKQIMATFKEIVTMSFGIRSEDGRYFEKSPQILQRFMSSAAYSELFIELISDPNAMTEFVRGLTPTKMHEEFDKQLAASDLPQSSQTARERSEAQMQGYQKKAQNPRESVSQVPELPTVAPVLEEPASGGDAPARQLTDAEILAQYRQDRHDRNASTEVNSGYRSQNFQ